MVVFLLLLIIICYYVFYSDGKANLCYNTPNIKKMNLLGKSLFLIHSILLPAQPPTAIPRIVISGFIDFNDFSKT